MRVSSNDINRMKKLRLGNANKIIISHLNKNLLRNKFVFVKDIIKLLMFLISESMLDHTFPSNHFKINGYKIFRPECNRFEDRCINSVYK